MALYSVMMGGGKKDISEIFTNDKALQIFLFSLLIFLIKSFIIQWSYNSIWPKLSYNSGNTTQDFKPLTFVEAMILTLLALNIFKL